MAASLAVLATLALLPRVVAEPPPGWVSAEIEAPKIAESAGAVMTQWQAVRAEDGGAALVTGCVATPVPGWVDDMRPAVEARTTALAGAAAARITGVPIDVRAESSLAPERPQGVFALRAANDLAGPVIGSARTFLGFDEARVFTCFATCANRPRASTSGHEACARAVASARLDGSGPPPPPGLGLRGATWAVHHPRPFAVGAGLVVIVLGILAVVTRRRPRSAPPSDKGAGNRA